MQRAHRISIICISVLALLGGATLQGQDSARVSKADLAARKTAAAKAVNKARTAAKAVQKAQDNSAAKRVKTDKLLETATADKAELTAALGRNARPEEIQKLTQTAQKSAEAARKAQDESDVALQGVQAAMMVARQTEVEVRVAFEARHA